jgi:hypothetical protein
MSRTSASRKKVLIKVGMAAVVGCCLSLFFISQEIPPSSHAAGPTKPVQVMHRPLEGNAIPQATLPMNIVAELKNSRQTDVTIRVVGSKDGRLIDIVMPKGELNTVDNAEYSLTIPAPVAVMSYQFVIHQPDGSVTTTKRFSIKRPCIQTFSVDEFKGDPDAEFKQKLGALVSELKTLESNTASYDEAFKILAEIKAAHS